MFLRIWTVFDPFWEFRSFLDPDFSFFCFFCIFDDGILARRSRPCVVAHRKTVLRYNVCPRLDPEKPSPDEVLAGNGFELGERLSDSRGDREAVSLESG